jgi:hypothetical protein
MRKENGPGGAGEAATHAPMIHYDRGMAFCGHSSAAPTLNEMSCLRCLLCGRREQGLDRLLPGFVLAGEPMVLVSSTQTSARCWCLIYVRLATRCGMALRLPQLLPQPLRCHNGLRFDACCAASMVGPGAIFGGGAVEPHTIVVTSESATVICLSKRVISAAMGPALLKKLTRKADAVNEWRCAVGDGQVAELAGEEPRRIPV